MHEVYDNKLVIHYTTFNIQSVTMSLTSEVDVCVTEQNILFLFGVDLGRFLMYLLPRVHNLQRVSSHTINS